MLLNKIDLIKNDHTSVIKVDDGRYFEFSYTETVFIMIILYSCSPGGKYIHISMMN